MSDAVDLAQGKTSPPDYLTESELIGLMEKHGIGTDASISVHIAKVLSEAPLPTSSNTQCESCSFVASAERAALRHVVAAMNLKPPTGVDRGCLCVQVCERYVSIQSGRRLMPTELGVTLVRGYQLIDPDLCLPLVRASKHP